MGKLRDMLGGGPGSAMATMSRLQNPEMQAGLGQNMMQRLMQRFAPQGTPQGMPQQQGYNPFTNPHAFANNGRMNMQQGMQRTFNQMPWNQPQQSQPGQQPPVAAPPPQNIMAPPPGQSQPGVQYAKGGFIADHSPGRGDKIATRVRAKSYVLPADIISAAGQGNSLAGARAIKNMVRMKKPRQPRPKGMADGGPADNDEVDVALSGGEMVLTPEEVAAIGEGDIDLGHSILDKFVKQTRAKNIRTLKRLPGPKQ